MAARPLPHLSLAACAAAHGVLTLPGSRNGGSLSKAAVHPGAQAAYYTSNTKIPGQAANCAKDMITTSYSPCSPGSYAGKNPWMAPGTAPVHSPCGNGKSDGKDGMDLPKTPRHQWQAGTTVEVAWAIQNNHGGGYAYRLCPAAEATTEACFQRGHLAFADDTSVVHYTNGTELSFPAATTTAGTSPAGSMWRRNSIPARKGMSGVAFGPPCPGCIGDDPPFSVLDRVVLPAGLAPGDYTLGWRWDCEQQGSVWLNCADVTVTGGAPAPPSPSAAKYGCVDSRCVADPTGVPQATCLKVCKGGGE